MPRERLHCDVIEYGGKFYGRMWRASSPEALAITLPAVSRDVALRAINAHRRNYRRAMRHA